MTKTVCQPLDSFPWQDAIVWSLQWTRVDLVRPIQSTDAATQVVGRSVAPSAASADFRADNLLL